LSCRQPEEGGQPEKPRGGCQSRRGALPFDGPAVPGAFADECRYHLQPSGIDALQGGDIERYRKGFVEQSGEILLEGGCIADQTLGRQGQ
jgi:hypothetical protein